MNAEEKFQAYLDSLPTGFSCVMVESFYSLWKPEAKRIVTIVNTPIEKHNEVYALALEVAIKIYDKEVIPFIINVGTREADTSFSQDTEDLLGFPEYNDPIG